MLFKNLLLSCFIATTLTACSGSFLDRNSRTSEKYRLTEEQYNNLSPAAKMVKIHADYKSYLSLVKSYSSQPFCTEVLITSCAQPVAVIRLSEAVQEADKIMDTAWSIVKSNSEESDIAVATARVAVATVSDLLINAGVLTDG